mgnify:CR=1 FL=1
MLNQMKHHWQARSRREFFTQAGSGLAGLALSSMLAEAAPKSADPMESRQPHHKPMAKSVIWLFMEGGPSHVDLFDPKPALDKLDGKPMPDSFGRPITAMGTANNTIMRSKRQWKQHGQGGLWISDWLPHTAQCADDLASADSLAWSFAARREPPLPGHDEPGPGRRAGHKHCNNCPEFALAWRDQLLARLRVAASEALAQRARRARSPFAAVAEVLAPHAFTRAA